MIVTLSGGSHHGLLHGLVETQIEDLVCVLQGRVTIPYSFSIALQGHKLQQVGIEDSCSMKVSFIAKFLHDRYTMILHQDNGDKTPAIVKGDKLMLVTLPVFHSHPLTR